ncbi:hypothetical protein Slin15195_G026690 [Septoria linicola]|uniref:Stc1 domain-containing protein n=1 Tax=Septoria linicola TaxID=215465 RepID=A0A9Q9EFV2_9PEZI|nr:hypothetical protein Slin15195_G026690 [Septoria linicola]
MCEVLCEAHKSQALEAKCTTCKVWKIRAPGQFNKRQFKLAVPNDYQGECEPCQKKRNEDEPDASDGDITSVESSDFEDEAEDDFE